MLIKKFIGLSLLLLLTITGCTTAPPKSTPPRKVALVLGGGGARGFAHVGVIRELEAADIPIDLIVGVSVGGLIGVLYGDSKDSFQLEWTSFQIKKEEIFDFNLLNINNSIAKGEAIKSYLDRTLNSTYLEELKVPVVIVATDLETGTPIIFQKGPIKDAIRASTSVPGVFPPVRYGNQLLVDGGVLGNLAPQVAKDLGATVIIGVNIAKSRTNFHGQQPNILHVISESINIMGDEIINAKRDQFDVLIEPDVGNVDITDFSQKKKLIESGRQATLKVIDKIQSLIKE